MYSVVYTQVINKHFIAKQRPRYFQTRNLPGSLIILNYPSFKKYLIGHIAKKGPLNFRKKVRSKKFYALKKFKWRIFYQTTQSLRMHFPLTLSSRAYHTQSSHQLKICTPRIRAPRMQQKYAYAENEYNIFFLRQEISLRDKHIQYLIFNSDHCFSLRVILFGSLDIIQTLQCYIPQYTIQGICRRIKTMIKPLSNG